MVHSGDGVYWKYLTWYMLGLHYRFSQLPSHWWLNLWSAVYPMLSSPLSLSPDKCYSRFILLELKSESGSKVSPPVIKAARWKLTVCSSHTTSIPNDSSTRWVLPHAGGSQMWLPFCTLLSQGSLQFSPCLSQCRCPNQWAKQVAFAFRLLPMRPPSVIQTRVHTWASCIDPNDPI